jgi:hypothetical protein
MAPQHGIGDRTGARARAMVHPGVFGDMAVKKIVGNALNFGSQVRAQTQHGVDCQELAIGGARASVCTERVGPLATVTHCGRLDIVCLRRPPGEANR